MPVVPVPSKKHSLQFASVAVGSTAFKFRVSVIAVTALVVVVTISGACSLDVEGLKYNETAWLIIGSVTPACKNNIL